MTHDEVFQDLVNKQTEERAAWHRAALFALQIQNGVNYRGILNGFRPHAEFMHRMDPVHWRNHVITRLVFAKLIDLKARETGDTHAQSKFLTGNPTLMDKYVNWDGVNDETIDESLEISFWDDPSPAVFYGDMYRRVEQIRDVTRPYGDYNAVHAV